MSRGLGGAGCRVGGETGLNAAGGLRGLARTCIARGGQHAWHGHLALSAKSRGLAHHSPLRWSLGPTLTR